MKEKTKDIRPEWIRERLPEWLANRNDRPFRDMYKPHEELMISFAPADMDEAAPKIIDEAFENSILPGGNLNRPVFCKAEREWLCFEEYYPSLLEGYGSRAFTALNASQQDRTLLSMANALRTLHKAGLVHGSLDNNSFRAVKANDSNFRTVLSGFAFANREGRHTAGYPDGYRAPELQRRHEITAKTDIYALGACFYFFLTNRIPMRNDAGKILLPSFVPKKYRGIVSAMLASDPTARPDLTAIMERIRNGSGDGYADCVVYREEGPCQDSREYFDELAKDNRWLKG